MAKEDFDPYSVLGLDRQATDAEIRAAYRDLGAKYHPDKHQGNPLEGLAAEKMAEVNRAYDILSDATKRSAYDKGPRPWPRPASGTYSPSGGSGPRTASPIRWMRIVGLLLLLPLLVRFGAVFVRLIGRLVRGGVELSALARGTPLAAVLFVAAVGLMVYILVRRRRGRRDRPSGKT